MLRFQSRGQSAPVPPVFEVAPLDVYASSFPGIASANGLSLESRQALPGHRVRDVYLNDPELQKLYPLGLLPLGQLHFLSWLTKHGRADQGLADAEILQFLPPRPAAFPYRPRQDD
jgi:hypothetical protein